MRPAGPFAKVAPGAPRAGRRWYCQEGAGTRGLMAAQALDAWGPRGFLSHIARGSIVDEAALIRALQEGASPTPARVSSSTRRTSLPPSRPVGRSS
ncbi:MULTISPECIES: NAD(P)-dependent oxidoreductase [unclassified Myxococcus]|uniref:NAD(P)-dependent oxidoreductase n=1 Tax=Myxococcus TaxID=32 RepID=UPI001CC1C095|nr:hypothetical protein [Myxococcus sp. AS-1-15]MBZ4413794.1 hypothetical protein [Myxococcus sp. XM-1-1-1]